MISRKVIAGGIVVLAVLAVAANSGSQDVAAPEGTADVAAVEATPVSTEEATPAPTEEATPELTEAPTQESSAEDPLVYNVRDRIVVDSGDGTGFEATISKVGFKKNYSESGWTDRPQVKGDVYVQFWVTITALDDGVYYNAIDFTNMVNDMEVVPNSLTFVAMGPKPSLDSGSLQAGQKVSGWVVAEVPAEGQLVMGHGNPYVGNQADFFVLLRP